MPARLRRLREHFSRHPRWFVTACTHQRQPILATPETHQTLLAFAEEGPNRGAWLGSFVLMPDHLHLFVALDERELNLSAWVKSLKNTLSKSLRQTGIPSPHWQKTFFDHLLRTADSYSQKWDYVRQNPVRAGLVQHPEDWPFWAQPHPLEF